ncbi:MAG: hypothetical protein O7B99_03645 [Planctomycetota bacterium]|nr:hypothetical protein [Planctomycetota bacterium]
MRRVLSLLASVAIALLLLVGLEVALRVVGVGGFDESRASRLKYQQIFLPVMPRATRTDGVEVFRTTDPRLPYQAVPVEKAEGTLRVFTFGGSAMAGLGFSPNVTIARHLEQMLARAMPARTVEVVNLGLVALPSKKVKLLVFDVLERYDPDVVVVYSGNNEFLEIHSRKYAEANAGFGQKLRWFMTDTSLYRLVRPAKAYESSAQPLSTRDLAQNDERVAHSRIIRDVEMSADEIAAIHDGYERNLGEIARAAREAGVPAILMTVAANWEWRGREDLPDSWAEEVVPAAGEGRDEEYWRAVVGRIDTELAHSDAKSRHEWLHRRALANEALGETEDAARDHRAAMNADPSLRRATDDFAERVRSAAREEGARLVDSIEILAAASPDGVVGFDAFYDYVHLTPDGALLLAGAVFEELGSLGLLPPDTGLVPGDYLAERRLELERAEADPWFVLAWMGVGSDLEAGIAARDLWKYDRMLGELDAALADDPNDVAALVYRANAAFFRPDGARDAERDWHAAAELRPDRDEIRANLALLEGQRRP